MNAGKFLLKAGGVGLVSNAIILLMLAGCANGNGNRPVQWSVYEEPPSIYVMPDDYIYYPNYQVYYSSSRHQYAYREANAWVLRPAPPGVTVNALRTSPSVKMDFDDSPESHHAAVVQKYPKNRCSPGSNNGQNTNPKDYPQAIENKPANSARALKGSLC